MKSSFVSARGSNDTRAVKLNTTRRIRQKILVVLAMILMATAYGLPSGLHLSFCFAEDGHWDITAVVCPSDQQTPVSRHSNAKPSDHQEKCNDFTTSCDEKEICRPNFVLFPRTTSSKLLELASAAKAPALIPLHTFKPSTLPASSEIFFALQAYLRSVVLLI